MLLEDPLNDRYTVSRHIITIATTLKIYRKGFYNIHQHAEANDLKRLLRDDQANIASSCS
jgi:hypothetical protein